LGGLGIGGLWEESNAAVVMKEVHAALGFAGDGMECRRDLSFLVAKVIVHQGIKAGGNAAGLRGGTDDEASLIEIANAVVIWGDRSAGDEDLIDIAGAMVAFGFRGQIGSKRFKKRTGRVWRGGSAVKRRRHRIGQREVVVVVAVSEECVTDLMEISCADSDLRSPSGRSYRGYKQCEKNSNDAKDDEEFEEGEGGRSSRM